MVEVREVGFGERRRRVFYRKGEGTRARQEQDPAPEGRSQTRRIVIYIKTSLQGPQRVHLYENMFETHVYAQPEGNSKGGPSSQDGIYGVQPNQDLSSNDNCKGVISWFISPRYYENLPEE